MPPSGLTVSIPRASFSASTLSSAREQALARSPRAKQSSPKGQGDSPSRRYERPTIASSSRFSETQPATSPARSITEKLAASEKLRRALEAELVSLRRALRAEQTRLEETEAHRDELLAGLASIEKDLAAERASRGQMEAMIHRLEAIGTRERAATSNAVGKVEAIRSKMEAQARLLAEAALAREKIRDETAEANRLLSVANAQKAGIEELAKRAMIQLKEVQGEKEALRSKLEAAERRAESAAAEVARLTTIVKDSAESLATERAHAQHSCARAERCEAALQELSSSHGELGRLRVERSEWLVDRARLKHVEAEVEELRAEMQRSETEAQAATDLLMARHAEELAKAGHQAATAASDASALREALLRADGERIGLERLVEALNGRAEEHKLDLAAKAAEVKAAYSKVEEERAGAEEARRAAAAEVKTTEGLRDALGVQQANYEKLLAELDGARAESAAAAEARSAMQTELTFLKSKLAQTMEKLEMSEKNATQRSEDLERLRTNALQSEQRWREADQERGRLCEAIEALQHEKVALEQLAQHVHAVTQLLPLHASEDGRLVAVPSTHSGVWTPRTKDGGLEGSNRLHFSPPPSHSQVPIPSS